MQTHLVLAEREGIKLTDLYILLFEKNLTFLPSDGKTDCKNNAWTIVESYVTGVQSATQAPFYTKSKYLRPSF